jgi:hypothetical protein
MNTCMANSDCAQFPISDYDALEREVSSMRARMRLVEPRYEAMTEQLDRITTPGSRAQPEPPETRGRGYEFRGQFFRARTCIEIHGALMEKLWTEFPEQRPAMAEAAARDSRSRSYIARRPEDLFRDRSADWSRRHSRRLVDGWFIDINMNPKQMQAILKSVVAAAGLLWGKDVKVMWE